MKKIISTDSYSPFLEMCRTPFYRTYNELEHVHLLVIELEPPIFGFEGMDIEH